MLMIILTRTPVWVWVLLVALIVLGLTQTRTRQLTLKRLTMMPFAMMGFSLFGTISAVGFAFNTVLLWLLAYLGSAYLLSRKPLPANLYNEHTQRFTILGSYVPLFVMLGIFITKFAVGVITSVNLAIVHSPEFAILVACIYGVFSGVFAGRALRALKLVKLSWLNKI